MKKERKKKERKKERKKEKRKKETKKGQTKEKGEKQSKKERKERRKKVGIKAIKNSFIYQVVHPDLGLDRPVFRYALSVTISETWAATAMPN